MYFQRAAFRFSLIYFGLFCLLTQIAGSLFVTPSSSFRGFGTVWPFRVITSWIAVHIFGITEPLIFTRNSGETAFFWVQTFWVLIAAVIGTCIWLFLYPPPKDYGAVGKWFRVFIRLALAASMFEYGMTKVIPTQFPRPSLTTLVTPVGNLSLSALLWAAIGASPAYEMFTGWAEIAGGLLLLWPRTTLLGAIICLIDMTQVFVLNMTYDIGLKQISFHLILLSLILIAPDLRRLRALFLSDHGSVPPRGEQPELLRHASANRIARAAQFVIGLYLLATYAYINWNYWQVAGGGRERPPLYGIWNVEELSVDGNVRPAESNDYDRRWRRVIFDIPNAIAFQRTDDSFARYGASVDVYKHTIALTKGSSRNWKSNFIFDQSGDDQLTLDGEMDGHRIHAQLAAAKPDTFRLLNSRFRWVRPEEP